ncbi:ABC transporter permease [Paenibacillus thailandensis]|uniref:ABC transporter permease n=1 Tax=Paenibacillus thailandensis TaxID=393250 RepID=A0ABW5R1S0_9BACL
MNESPAAAAFQETKKRRGLLSYRLEWDSSRKEGSWWVTVVSVVLALVFCGIFIWANGMNPLTVYAKMLKGAFGSEFGLTETFVKAIPLLLCGLGVAVAYRLSIWNIGAEGQFAIGAIAATAVTIYFPAMPGYMAIPTMIVFAVAGGGLWGLLTAIPRTYFQVNELISSLMLNYVALLALDYVVFGPWKDPKGFNFPGTAMFSDAQSLPLLGSTRLHFGIVFAIVAVVLYFIVMKYTRWGYEWRLIGANPEAARHSGIPINRHILLVMIISGGLAGLAGMAEVSGVAHRLMYGLSPGYGYTAIIVAWLARLHPVGLVLSSFLFGGLIVGGYSVQTIGLPSSISEMIQGAILFFLIGGATVSKFRLRKNG